jgi:transposase
MQTTDKAYIGIDVSKATLHACFWCENGKHKDRVFDNTAKGHQKLLGWAQHLADKQTLHFCMEATGAYSTLVAQYLADCEQAVSIVNPARIKYAGFAYGSGNKNDTADARTIAAFAKKEQPSLWLGATPEARLLRALVRRRHDVIELLVAEKNRLQEPALPKAIATSLKKSVSFLEAEVTALEAQIRTHIDQHPDLKQKRDLLESIPGIAETTASELIAELPDVSAFQNAQAMAAYAGLNPRQYQSGSSILRPTRISKRGRGALRRLVYLPAMSAIQRNPLVKAFYARRLEAGLCKMAALAAAMRKLLMLCYGVLKSGQKFDPEFSARRA